MKRGDKMDGSEEEMLNVCRKKLKRCRELKDKIETLKSKLKERKESAKEMKGVTKELKEIAGKHEGIVYCLNCHEAYLKENLPSKRLFELKILKYTVVDCAHGESADGERMAKKISELAVYTCPHCRAKLCSEVTGRYPYKIRKFFEINGDLYPYGDVKKTKKAYGEFLDHTLESWNEFEKKLEGL